MKFDKFIKLLKCGKTGSLKPFNVYLTLLEWEEKALFLFEIESDRWQVEDETLTFQQVLDLSKLVGQVIVKRLGWVGIDAKKVFIVCEGGIIQEQLTYSGHIGDIVSMDKEDEIATDWIIVED